MGPIEELLRNAWKLIENPENRCRRVFAVDALGHEVDSKSNIACKWCSYGAVFKAQKNTKQGDIASKYLIQAAINVGSGDVIRYNDSDIVNNPPKLYAEAIRLAQESGE